MLWLCLYFPRLGLEIFTRGRQLNDAVAVCEGRGRERRVLHANATALRHGIAPGLRASAAFALASPVQIISRDADAERAALHNLAAWAGQFSSLIHLVEPQALLLEIGGSLRLFQGIERLLSRIEHGLVELGYTAQAAVAPVKLAAAWLARAAPGTRIVESSQLSETLSVLPLTVLDLTPEQRERLKGMGITCIGECRRLPRAGLVKRFGAVLLLQLDRAHGHIADPRTPFVAPATFSAHIELPGTVEQIEGLVFGVHRLVIELCGWLRIHSAGATAMTLTLLHPQHAPTRIGLGLVAPSREPGHLTDLLRERLAQSTLPEAVETMRLELAQRQALGTPTRELFPVRRDAETSVTMLIERLRIRLGADQVSGVQTVAEHRPEYGQTRVQPDGTANTGAPPAANPRPFWLLPEPAPLQVTGAHPYLDGRLELEGAAERIESGWWDGDDIGRDYFRAHNRAGECFWIFRELRPPYRWWLHGIFA